MSIGHLSIPVGRWAPEPGEFLPEARKCVRLLHSVEIRNEVTMPQKQDRRDKLTPRLSPDFHVHSMAYLIHTQHNQHRQHTYKYNTHAHTCMRVHTHTTNKEVLSRRHNKEKDALQL